jgi:Tfp pilus assembly protein PilN
VKPVLTLALNAGQARAELKRGANVLWAAESPVVAPDELREAVAQLAAGQSMPLRARRIRVELGAPVVQLRTLHGLPPVRTAHLRTLVATQSGRFFRRNGSPLVTDATWQGGRPQSGIAVAAAAEEPWIAAILQGAEAAGLAVDSIRPAGTADGARLELLSPEERARRRRRERVALGRMVGLGAACWIAAGAVWGIRFERERRSVDREIERLRAPAAAIGTARRALGNATALVDSIETAQRDRARPLGRLAALSVALPDSSYATSLTFDGTGGELAMVARRSSEVTAALEQVRAIAAPRIEGSVVREASGGREWERFGVRFEAAP